MTQTIKTYYIPQNLNITQGKIYNLYLNKITNLDLSSIIEKKDITLNGILQPNPQVQPNNQIQTPSTSTSTMALSEEDYTNILSLADISTKLYKQSQELVKKISRGRK